MKYRTKSVEIEAIQFINGEVDEKPDWILDAFGDLPIYADSLGRWFISTPKGDMRVLNGDYIIRDVKGEIDSYRQDVFEQMYERVGGKTAKQFEEMFPSLASAEAFTVGGRRFVSMDKVLEIVKEKWRECDFRYGESNEIRAAMNTAKDIYSAVEAMKEGEQE